MCRNLFALVTVSFLLAGSGCVQQDRQVPVPNTNVSFRPPTSSPPPSTAVQTTDDYARPAPVDPLTPSAMTPENMTTFPGVLPPAERVGKKIRIHTAKGDIVFSLFGEDAPLATSNFVWLTQHHFYDGLTFHRREEGFVIQGGDPKGNGTGGPGWRFRDEPVTRPYNHGIVAMANSGPNTNGSQFFIMLKDVPLDPLYTIFGQVESGLDVVDNIQVGDKMLTVTIE